MESLIIPLLAAILGLVIGGLLVSRFVGGRAAAEPTTAGLALELATTRERLSAVEADRLHLLRAQEEGKAQALEWRDALDDACNERAQLSERAARVPLLEAQVARLLDQQRIDQREMLQLATREAQKAQSLQSVAARLAQIEADLAASVRARELAASALQQANERRATLTAELDAERSQNEEKLDLLLQAREALANQFKSLANDILEEKARRFTEQNQINLGQLLDPLKTRLQEFQGKVEEVYVQEGKDRTALAEQVRQLMDLNQSLSEDAKNLTRALKGSGKAQGNWGELVLERVLEASGLRKGEEYDVQESHNRDDGTRAQPDVVVHLPEDRHLVVDAKASLIAYEDFASAEDEGDRQAALKRHLDSVRAHIKGLSGKNYQVLYGLKSLDFVLMFVPIEPAFMLAVSHDRELFMDAWQKNVLLVSPSTLLFVVRTVAHLWRQEAQSRNAQEIARRGADLYDKLVAFVVDLESVGARLKQAQREYDAAHGKLTGGRGNLIRQAEMLRQLGVKPGKALPVALVELAAETAGEAAVVTAIGPAASANTLPADNSPLRSQPCPPPPSWSPG
jgi:DNA recombination protein RmuC